MLLWPFRWWARRWTPSQMRKTPSPSYFQLHLPIKSRITSFENKFWNIISTVSISLIKVREIRQTAPHSVFSQLMKDQSLRRPASRLNPPLLSSTHLTELPAWWTVGCSYSKPVKILLSTLEKEKPTLSNKFSRRIGVQSQKQSTWLCIIH